jgi:bacterioferritin-associated ferredoxin
LSTNNDQSNESYEINIDRCFCEQKTFAYLVSVAHQESLTLGALAAREGCGTHCGWCVAYLRRALRTGETAFHELLDKEPLDDQVNDQEDQNVQSAGQA